VKVSVKKKEEKAVVAEIQSLCNGHHDTKSKERKKHAEMRKEESNVEEKSAYSVVGVTCLTGEEVHLLESLLRRLH